MDLVAFYSDNPSLNPNEVTILCVKCFEKNKSKWKNSSRLVMVWCGSAVKGADDCCQTFSPFEIEFKLLFAKIVRFYCKIV